MIDTNTIAAAKFYRSIRDFVATIQPWDTRAIYYDVKPDEVRDLTLVSKRVYGNRDETLAVMAAAGLNHIDQELKQGRMVLPNSTTLYQLKRQSGFESVADLRENFKPVWAE